MGAINCGVYTHSAFFSVLLLLPINDRIITIFYIFREHTMHEDLFYLANNKTGRTEEVTVLLSNSIAGE